MERIGGDCAYVSYPVLVSFFSAKCGEKCQHHLVTCMCELTKFPFYNQLMNSLTL